MQQLARIIQATKPHSSHMDLNLWVQMERPQLLKAHDFFTKKPVPLRERVRTAYFWPNGKVVLYRFDYLELLGEFREDKQESWEEWARDNNCQM